MTTSFLPPVIHIQLDVFLLILLRHGNVPTILLQLVDLQHTEAVVFHAEGGVDHVRDAVLQHPLEGNEEVGVDRLDINQADTLVEQHLNKVNHIEPGISIFENP